MPKEFKTYIEQIELLKAKGLIIPNQALALYALKNYGYFNVINRYKAPFITNYDGLEVYEATFDDIYTLFLADNTLRNLLFPYLTDFEQKLKASIAHHFSEKYGLDHKKYISNNNFKMDQKNNRKTQNLINQISRKGVYDVSNE